MAGDYRVEQLRRMYVEGRIEVDEFERQLDDLLHDEGSVPNTRAADAILKDMFEQGAARRSQQ